MLWKFYLNRHGNEVEKTLLILRSTVLTFFNIKADFKSKSCQEGKILTLDILGNSSVISYLIV